MLTPEYFSEPDSVWLCIYAFDDSRFYPTAWDVRLERKGTTYRGTFSAVPSDAVFLLFRIVSGREYDDNRGRFWDAACLEWERSENWCLFPSSDFVLRARGKWYRISCTAR
ncbi:MAG: hypothetical protein KatS3mg040_1020 [Candidatus Kapaibacterium sp.]|nr:MAG: hypothetical protein KatS3mg040_1020 [Candidatus Kapabacteria bacterium]